jgi:alkylation response protein AidB-like acyl-CoA dehydrogenase
METFTWWSAEEKKLAIEAKEFINGIIPMAEEAWWRKEYPRSVMDKIAEKGYFGAAIPRKYGGMELGTTGTCIIAEEIGRIMGVSKLFGATMIGGVHQILEFGTEEQKKRFLPRIAAGELGALGITEPYVGSDAAGIETFARHEGDKYTITGKKRMVVGTGVASHYMMYARTSNDAEDIHKHRHLSAFIVEKGMPGFTVEKINELLSLDYIPNGYLNLDDVPVPLDNRFGEEGEGWKVMVSGLNWERTIHAAYTIGALYEALRFVVPYAQRRIQFGKPTLDLVNNQFKIADLVTTLKLARLNTFYTAHLLDSGQEAAMESAICKVFNTDMGLQAMIDAIQVMGGDGVTKFYPLEKYFRDLKVDQIAAGTSEICKLVIFRMALSDMAEELKMPRRAMHQELGVPVRTFEKPLKHTQIDETGLLEVLAENYRINPGLYMTREDLKEEFDVKDDELDKLMIVLEQKGLMKLYRGRKGIELARATYEGLRQANPAEYYRWFPSWVKEEDIF